MNLNYSTTLFGIALFRFFHLCPHTTAVRSPSLLSPSSWSYIKDKKLQNPSNKREIVCDNSLKAVFEKDSVTMFEMNKLMSKHFSKPIGTP